MLLLVSSGYCQTDTDWIKGLNAIAQPITAIHPENEFTDLEFFREMTKDANIIGIGESTHGTALYDTYRQRLIRYLVRELGFKALVDEGDILAAERLDAYINFESDQVEMIGGLRPVLTNKKELEWLRDFNKNKPAQERVHIYGAEVRGFYGIIQKLITLSPKNEEDALLNKFMNDPGVGYKNLTQKDFEAIKEKAAKWTKEIDSPVGRYYCSLLDQQIDFAYRQRFGKNDFAIRDRYLFENIQSVVTRTPNHKAIILAHNGHLQKTQFSEESSLGFQLNSFYGSKYFVVATDFNSGNVNVFNIRTGRYENRYYEAVKDKKGIEYYFSQCRYPDFLLQARKAMQDSLAAFLVNTKFRMLRNITATGETIQTPIRIADNYDVVIFFNTTDNRD